MLDAQFSCWAALDLKWGDFLSQCLPRVRLPEGLPRPTDQQVTFDIQVDAAGACTLRAAVEFDHDTDIKLGGLELGRRFRLSLTVAFDAQELEDSDDAAELLSALEVEMDLGLDIRLQLPDVGLLRAEMGGSDGWLHLDLKAALADDALTLTAEAVEQAGAQAFLFAVAAFVPGAPSSPMLRAGLSRVSIKIPMDFGTNAAASVRMTCDSSISLYRVDLPDDAPFAYQFRQLFAELNERVSVPDQVTFAGTLVLEASASAFAVTILLHDARIDLKPFAILSGLSAGGAVPRPVQEVPIDVPIRFSFDGLYFKLGRTPADCVFEVVTRFTVGDVEAMAAVRLTGEQFAIAVGNIAIPLGMPRFPFTAEEFDACYEDPGIIDDALDELLQLPPAARAADGEYDDKVRRLSIKSSLLQTFKRIENGAGYTMGDDARARYRFWLREFVRAAELPNKLAGDEGTACYRITVRTIEQLKRARAPEQPPDGLVEKLSAIKERHIGAQSLRDALEAALDDDEFDRYAADIVRCARIRGETVTATLDGEPYVVAENLTLTIEEFALRISFRSPSNIGLDCTATLSAYNESAGQINVTLMAGISVDVIYFALKAPDGKISIPDIGRYKGGSINCSEFLIGFGYTKRSLAISFAGALVLPEELVNDLDLSEYAVLGIRLPVQTRLTFRLDVIPMTIGDVVLVIPLFQFNLDMRRTGVPALQDPTRCLPSWDGLQLVVHSPDGDRFRCGVRHIAFSLLFGMLPSVNWILGGDFVLGDDENGLSIVVYESLQLAPVQFYYPIVIPGFADTTPFVDDCCIDVRLAGFGVHLHLQRPFPSMSPLALPELFALLSDPENYPVNPRGELANSMRLSIFDTGITVPDSIARLFPAVRQIAGPPITETINLGTFITAAQKVSAAIKPVFEQAGAYIQAATANKPASGPTIEPPSLSPNEFIRLLPKSLQRMETQLSLGAFDGHAVIVFASAEEASAAFRQRDGATPQAVVAAGIEPGETFSAEALLNFQPKGVGNTPPPSLADLIDDDIFRHFEADDLEPSFIGMAAGTAVLAGARVRLLDQPVDFVGAVSSTGGFALVASAEQGPLQLGVAGIHLPLPFKAAGSGRLALSGHASREGVTATVTAKGSADWELLPHVIEASITDAALTLATSRSFALKGGVKLDLFDGKIAVDGSIDVGPAHAAVAGTLVSNVPWFDLGISCSGSLGPLQAVARPQEMVLVGTFFLADMSIGDVLFGNRRSRPQASTNKVSVDDLKRLIGRGQVSHAELNRLFGAGSRGNKASARRPKRAAVRSKKAAPKKSVANVVMPLAQIARLSNEKQVPLASLGSLFGGTRWRAPAGAANRLVWLGDLVSAIQNSGGTDGGKDAGKPDAASDTQAHVGQGLDLSAQGAIKVFGQVLAKARVRVTAESLEFAGDWTIENWTPALAAGPFLSGNLAARGVARLRDVIGSALPTLSGFVLWPDLQLEGHGQLRVRLTSDDDSPSVEIDGSARLDSGAHGLLLSASGVLRWHGHTWASGWLEIGAGGVGLGGNTTFTLEMPDIPAPGPGELSLPRLVLRLDLNGEFEMGRDGRSLSYAFDAHWLLGAKLGGGDQILPLATGGLRLDSGSALQLPMTLVSIDGFKMIQGLDSIMPQVQIWKPMPRDGDVLISFGKIDGEPAVQVGNDHSLQLKNAALSFQGVGIGPPVPVLADRLHETSSSVQRLDIAPETVSISNVAWPFKPFKVELAFEQGRLLVKVHAEIPNGTSPIVFPLQ